MTWDSLQITTSPQSFKISPWHRPVSLTNTKPPRHTTQWKQHQTHVWCYHIFSTRENANISRKQTTINLHREIQNSVFAKLFPNIRVLPASCTFQAFCNTIFTLAKKQKTCTRAHEIAVREANLKIVFSQNSYLWNFAALCFHLQALICFQNENNPCAKCVAKTWRPKGADFCRAQLEFWNLTTKVPSSQIVQHELQQRINNTKTIRIQSLTKSGFRTPLVAHLTIAGRDMSSVQKWKRLAELKKIKFAPTLFQIDNVRSLQHLWHYKKNLSSASVESEKSTPLIRFSLSFCPRILTHLTSMLTHLSLISTHSSLTCHSPQTHLSLTSQLLSRIFLFQSLALLDSGLLLSLSHSLALLVSRSLTLSLCSLAVSWCLDLLSQSLDLSVSRSPICQAVALSVSRSLGLSVFRSLTLSISCYFCLSVSCSLGSFSQSQSLGLPLSQTLTLSGLSLSCFLSLILSVAQSLGPRSLGLSLLVSRSLSLSVSRSHALSVSRSQGLSISRSRNLSVSRSWTLRLSNSRSLDLSNSRSLDLSVSMSLDFLTSNSDGHTLFQNVHVDNISTIFSQAIEGFPFKSFSFVFLCAVTEEFVQLGLLRNQKTAGMQEKITHDIFSKLQKELCSVQKKHANQFYLDDPLFKVPDCGNMFKKFILFKGCGCWLAQKRKYFSAAP